MMPEALYNADAAMTKFREELREKLLGAMSDSMPQEVIDSMVAEGMRKAFFDGYEVIDPNDYYKSRKIDKEPYLIEMCRTEMQAAMQVAIKQWLAENNETVMAELKKIVEASAGQALLTALGRIFGDAVQSSHSAFVNELNKLYSANPGLTRTY